MAPRAHRGCRPAESRSDGGAVASVVADRRRVKAAALDRPSRTDRRETMLTRKQDERPADLAAGPQRRIAAIGRNVLRALGEPGDLHRVQVQGLWEGYYRVNVFV